MTCRLFKLPSRQEVGGSGGREGHHARRSHDLSSSPRKLHLRDKTKNARLDNKLANIILCLEINIQDIILSQGMK